jgi:uncharacterized protein (TIGR03083 family)
MDDSYWDAVRTMRLAVADLLDTLTPTEWDAPSLCADWRVRDVAGHLSIVATITTRQMLAAGPRGRFDPNRINTVIAVRNGCRRPGDIVAAIREHAADRTTAKMLDTRNSLFDVIVHSQDIARPLGRDLAVPVDYTRRGLDRVWQMGWPFRARRQMSGLKLCATDTDWSVGAGPEVLSDALSMLLLLTGRGGAVADALHGAGVAELPKFDHG